MVPDEKHLVMVGKKLTCDDKAFDKVFPPCSERNVDKTVGRVVRSDGALGTGTIIESDGINATGVTAKHVLFKGKNKKPLFGHFFQCSIRTRPKKANFLAKITIDEVLINPTSDKDIALFKGKYTKPKPLLSGVITPVAEQSRKRKHILIHHHPLGIEDQRRNKGELDQASNETHYVSTLPGSSGAPVMTKSGDALIGIHTGSGAQIKKVRYTGGALKHLHNKEFSLSDCNEYVSIQKDELNGFNKSFKMARTKGKKK